MKALVLTEDAPLSNAADAVLQTLEARGFDVESGKGSQDGAWDMVVSWGRCDVQLPPSRLIVNPAPAVELARSPKQSAVILRLHGIPVAPENLPPDAPRPLRPPPRAEWIELLVYVADLRVLSVEESALQEVGVSLSQWRYQRLMEAACRSVYVLGLHFAVVTMRVHPSGAWHVAEVNPFPRVDASLARAYAAGIAELALHALENDGAQDESVLGSDPEFLMVSDHGKTLYASDYVRHQGTVGYDRQSRAHRGSQFPLVELRPHPSPSPLVLAANTQKAMAKAQTLLPTRGVRWLAGSRPMGRFPTGGHVHVSGVPLTTPVLAALDNFLALPVMLLEDRTRARQRRRKYGRLGDFRRKEHGGFEYRSLPSWLVSQEATLAVYCLAKVISHEWPRLGASRFQRLQAAKEFYFSKKARFRRRFPDEWRRILNTETAKQYKYELSYFTRKIQSGESWEDERDIKRAWWT